MTQLENDLSESDKPGPLFTDWVWGGAIASIVLITLTVFLLFGTTSSDLTCVRLVDSASVDSSSKPSVECKLIRHSAIQTMSSIKLIDPVAVDITEQVPSRGRVNSYSADLRLTNLPYTVPLLSSYDFDVVRQVKQEVNDFLLHSDASSFSTHFPKVEANND